MTSNICRATGGNVRPAQTSVERRARDGWNVWSRRKKWSNWGLRSPSREAWRQAVARASEKNAFTAAAAYSWEQSGSLSDNVTITITAWPRSRMGKKSVPLWNIKGQLRGKIFAVFWGWNDATLSFTRTDKAHKNKIYSAWKENVDLCGKGIHRNNISTWRRVVKC